MPNEIASIIQRLVHLTEKPSELAASIPAVQKAIWDLKEEGNSTHELEVLMDLAYDLEYFQPNLDIRSKDRALFGEDRALDEIRSTLKKLRNK